MVSLLSTVLLWLAVFIVFYCVSRLKEDVDENYRRHIQMHEGVLKRLERLQEAIATKLDSAVLISDQAKEDAIQGARTRVKIDRSAAADTKCAVIHEEGRCEQ